MVRAACTSSIGMRPTHEDNFLLNKHIINVETQKNMPLTHTEQYKSVCNQKVNLIAVSDGMGGHNAGEVASLYAVQALARLERDVQRYDNIECVIDTIQNGLNEINRDIYQMSRRSKDFFGMGTTLVMFASCGSEYAIFNIGDSRAYLYAGGKLKQLTVDHTEGQRLIDLGILTRKELLDFPARKNLNRYLGYYSPGYVMRADVFRIEIEDGLILLCTDGISDSLSEIDIEDILLKESDICNASQMLVNCAAVKPNADNATAVLIQFRR